MSAAAIHVTSVKVTHLIANKTLYSNRFANNNTAHSTFSRSAHVRAVQDKKRKQVDIELTLPFHVRKTPTRRRIAGLDE